ncbi:MAG: polysaccharide deacetylase family protein [Acidobacteriota bacterium]|nr:polysaccharide deacetylase family protein [Acidobacteriota bacterium]
MSQKSEKTAQVLSHPPRFLVSIDLEDIRLQADSPADGTARAQDNMRRFLRFFDDHKVKSTVFVVGELAEKLGSFIKEIRAAGHEIGCHTHDHAHVARLSPDVFRANILKNLESLNALGIEDVRGFRAPDYSLTHSSRWAYDILAELGFAYSSSVMPARNPVFGWKEFPPYPVRFDNGLWELPFSVTSLAGLKIPFCGGVYWRFFPRRILGLLCRRHAGRGFPLTGYFHPYDIDSGEKKYRVSGNPVFNWLVFYNRYSTFRKMAWIFERFRTERYIDYVHRLESASVEPAPQI